MELIAHAKPTRMPPTKTTIFGPKRSTSQPSIGTSQVSVNTKIVKAIWIAARPQWYFWSIGLTNNVQPYCRLAIITMQTMPTNNCAKRIDGGAMLPDLTYDIFSSSPGQLGIWCRIVPPVDTMDSLSNGLSGHPFTHFHLLIRVL